MVKSVLRCLVPAVCISVWPHVAVAAPAQTDPPMAAVKPTSQLAEADRRTPPQPSKPRTLTYDQSKCAQDPQGMVYFAVGLRVYRQPASNLIRISGRDPDYMRTLPVPPSPDEPEGCPDHPIQGAVFVLSRVSAIPNGTTPHYADQMRVIINGGPLKENRVFRGVCARSQLRDISHPGLVGCTKPDKAIDDTVYETTEHSAPDGEKIAFYCDVGLIGHEHPPRCNGGYWLHEGFGLNFFFDSVRIPIHEFIGADQELRRRFGAAEVKNYPWVTPTDDSEVGMSR